MSLGTWIEHSALRHIHLAAHFGFFEPCIPDIRPWTMTGWSCSNPAPSPSPERAPQNWWNDHENLPRKDHNELSKKSWLQSSAVFRWRDLINPKIFAQEPTQVLNGRADRPALKFRPRTTHALNLKSMLNQSLQ